MHGLVLSALVFALAASPAPAGGQGDGQDVFRLLEAIDAAAARQAWPGFDTADWPVAVYDGTRTLLLRHPNPPPGFSPLPGHAGVLAAPGRYPAVAGNSTVNIAGTWTATIIATSPSVRESALLACVEELFHVFWRSRHSNFRPNEMARYSYPVKDARNLQRLLAEDEALARALEAPGVTQAASWAAAALGVRRQRAALLTASDQAFEIGMEMMEGPANYVARTVVGLGAAETARRLREERRADQLRWRYYDSGAAIALLLDRLRPDWKRRVDEDPELTTASLLEQALAARGARPAAFAPAETSAFESRAAAAIAELSARQARVREDVLSRTGFRVIVEAAGAAGPLRVSRFDPIDLLVLEGGEVVHPRYLTLSNPDGTIELTNPAYARGSFGGVVALTSPAGRHPLAEGIRSLTLAGLTAAPKIDRQEGRLIVEADGVRIALGQAESRTEGRVLRIVSAAGHAPGRGADVHAAASAPATVGDYFDCGSHGALGRTIGEASRPSEARRWTTHDRMRATPASSVPRMASVAARPVPTARRGASTGLPPEEGARTPPFSAASSRKTTGATRR